MSVQRLFPAQKTFRALAPVLVLGCALLGSSVALADNEDDEPVRDRGIIGTIMSGLGATDGSETIHYRERSPLVIPPKLNLPPPESRPREGANWPKDPDVAERRAQRKAVRERDKWKENDPSYALTPQNLDPAGQARARTAVATPQPGKDEERRIINEGGGILSPGQLGVTTNLFGLFGGKKKDAEQEKFSGEPTREALTQPPPGYQTPARTGAGYAPSAESKQRADRLGETTNDYLIPGR